MELEQQALNLEITLDYIVSKNLQPPNQIQ
jgi:hypothetical protein